MSGVGRRSKSEPVAAAMTFARTAATGAIFALQFLTIAPLGLRRAPRPAELGASDAFFPLVGLALGAVLALLDVPLDAVAAPAVRDLLLVIALALMTGGLHLDGVADTVDGLSTGPDRAARLAAMRDPSLGTAAIVALAGHLVLKVAALGALAGDARVIALLLGPCLGRLAIVVARWTFPYARPEGVTRTFKDASRPRYVLAAGAWACGAAAWLAGPLGLVLVVATVLVVLAAGSLASARLGGLTGDVYGALCELAEVGAWLALGALTFRTAAWG